MLAGIESAPDCGALSHGIDTADRESHLVEGCGRLSQRFSIDMQSYYIVHMYEAGMEELLQGYLMPSLPKLERNLRTVDLGRHHLHALIMRVDIEAHAPIVSS